MVYGPSTNETDNGYIGSINDEGCVTVYFENGRGKIQPKVDDGVAFYYTAIPVDKNFTLRARAHVDNWDYSNGQEVFGTMAADVVPVHGTDSFLNSQSMALAGKIAYYFQGGKQADAGQKFSMCMGLSVLAKPGPGNLLRCAVDGR